MYTRGRLLPLVPGGNSGDNDAFRFTIQLAIAAALIVAAAAPIASWANERSDAVTFERDVMAVLSKAGCNAGTCHGNVNGKGGFFLSLRGQDSRYDYQQLVQADAGRRVNRLFPAESLALLKATAHVPHGGGKRFARESPEYRIMSRWITEGLAGVDSGAPTVTRLTITPLDLVLWHPERQAALNVVAEFSDGARRDVTRLAVYEPSDPQVEVTAEGVVQFAEPGVVTVVVRYLDRQTPVRIACRPALGEFVWSNPPANNFIDEFVFARLQQLKINPAPLAEDRVFVRRVFLDVLGTLPAADEARAFVADTSPNKREKLVDAVLTRPEFASMWALKWSDVIRNEEKQLDAQGVEKLHAWIRQSFAEDKPLNQFARELIESRGSTYANPPANFSCAHREPFVRAETTAQVFLGVRLQCEKCHNHPFDHWSQDEYYQWASLFSVIDYEIVANERKDKLDKHEFVGDQIVQIKSEGNVKNARTGQAAPARFLGAEQDIEGDRLRQLAAWLAEDNPLFAAAQANRIWYHVMGRGLVEPVDDLRLTNPASHPQLLERLANELQANNFSVKHLVKTIVLSRTYQLASAVESQGTTDPQGDEELYARAVVRRLSAEQILDAQSHILGTPSQLPRLPRRDARR